VSQPKNRAPSLVTQVAVGLFLSGLVCAGATALHLRSTMRMLEVRASSEGTEYARDAGCWKAYGTFEGPDYVVTCLVPDSPDAPAPACAALYPAVVPYLDGGTGRVRLQRLSQYPSGRVVCEDRLGRGTGIGEDARTNTTASATTDAG
jgi:hypothetical protein